MIVEEATQIFERLGELEDIPYLLSVAQDDSSIAIRNNSADAVSDILSRHRIGQARTALSEEERMVLLKQIRKISASKTIVVYLMIGSLGIPRSLSAICAGLHNPHAEVQIGALLGLRSYCLSADQNGNPETEAKVLSLYKMITAFLGRCWCNWRNTVPMLAMSQRCP